MNQLAPLKFNLPPDCGWHSKKEKTKDIYSTKQKTMGKWGAGSRHNKGDKLFLKERMAQLQVSSK